MSPGRREEPALHGFGWRESGTFQSWDEGDYRRVQDTALPRTARLEVWKDNDGKIVFHVHEQI